MKLIVFINRHKFYNLFSELDKVKLNAIDYTWIKNGPGGQTKEYFTDEKVISFSETRLQLHCNADVNTIQSPIIIIADEAIERFVRDRTSIVQGDYKLLYHTKTKGWPKALAAISESATCSKESQEDESTAYGVLAGFIANGATKEQIADFITDLCDEKLEQALNLLYESLTPEGACALTEPKYPDVWSKSEAAVAHLAKQSDPFDPDTFLKPLETLRKTLLNQD